MTLSDDTARHLAEQLWARGLSIPEDISLVGFRDTIIAQTMNPKLTTIHVPAEDMGYAAARWLIHRIKSGSAVPSLRMHLSPSLVIRQSTRQVSG